MRVSPPQITPSQLHERAPVPGYMWGGNTAKAKASRPHRLCDGPWASATRADLERFLTQLAGQGCLMLPAHVSEGTTLVLKVQACAQLPQDLPVRQRGSCPLRGEYSH